MRRPAASVWVARCWASSTELQAPVQVRSLWPACGKACTHIWGAAWGPDACTHACMRRYVSHTAVEPVAWRARPLAAKQYDHAMRLPRQQHIAWWMHMRVTVHGALMQAGNSASGYGYVLLGILHHPAAPQWQICSCAHLRSVPLLVLDVARHVCERQLADHPFVGALYMQAVLMDTLNNSHHVDPGCAAWRWQWARMAHGLPEGLGGFGGACT